MGEVGKKMEKDCGGSTRAGFPAKIVGSRPQRATMNPQGVGWKLDLADLHPCFYRENIYAFKCEQP